MKWEVLSHIFNSKSAVSVLREIVSGSLDTPGSHEEEATQEDKPEESRIRQILPHQLPGDWEDVGRGAS